MKAVFAVAAGAVAAQAMNLDSDVQLFREFKLKHNKVYETDVQETERFQIFKENVAYINSHNMNSETHGFTLGINHLADLSHAEYKAFLLGSGAPSSGSNSSAYLAPQNYDAPTEVDWRSQGYVTPVKDQGQCGSCWAFSTVASLEGQYFKKNGNLVSLAEQQLVDCSRSFGNQGCNGGLMDQGFQYIKSHSTGMALESSYRYTARDGSCHPDSDLSFPSPAATVTGFTDVQVGSEADLTNALATVGPIAVAIDASHQSFQLYRSGVYYAALCSSKRLDHGVTAVGYGVDGKHDYYIVKNSWGAVWGEQGYIKMSRNRNTNCAIASSASSPLV
jgi:cathepsin L